MRMVERRMKMWRGMGDVKDEGLGLLERMEYFLLGISIDKFFVFDLISQDLEHQSHEGK